MTSKACAQIETSPQPDLIINVIMVDDADYSFLQSVWADYFPTQRIQWLDELEKDPSSSWDSQVWSGWALNENGYWYDTTPEIRRVAN